MAAQLRYFADPRLIPLAVALETLDLDPDNELNHTEESVQEIVKLLIRFGWRDPVHAIKSRKRVKLVSRGNRTLMAARWLAEAAASDDPELRARAVGHESWWTSADPPDWLMVPALLFADDAATRTAWRISHNKSAEAPAWDWGVLAENMAEVSDEVDWGELGWSAAELAELFEPDPPEPDPPGDPPVPEPPTDPVTKPGDVWQLGDHRLICGDCRDPEVVSRLLDGEVINVAFTSPPYASQRKYDESSGFKPIKPDEYVDWFEAVQANVREHLAEDGSWFVNIKAVSDGLTTQLYVLDLVVAHVRTWGWLWAHELCWERVGMPKRVTKRFKNQFEPIYQFATGPWKMRPQAVMHHSDAVPIARGGGHGDTSWSDSHGTFCEQGSGGEILPDSAPGMAYPGNRLPPFASSRGLGHPAVFPVGLPTFFIKAYSDPGDRVFDPFMGSGTVFIACEREGRVGYGCEVSRGYCDVIVMRWQAETGRLAKRLDVNGKKLKGIALANAKAPA